MKYQLYLTLIIMLGCNGGAGVPCVDESRVDPEKVCLAIYDPVCGCNHVTYGNDCEAQREGVMRWEIGECEDDRPEMVIHDELGQ